MFILKKDDAIVIFQVYIDDIIFGATDDSLCKEFKDIMKTYDKVLINRHIMIKSEWILNVLADFYLKI